MKKGAFYASFVDKGRFKELLESIPVWIVLNDRAALLGAARYAENRNRPGVHPACRNFTDRLRNRLEIDARCRCQPLD